MRCRNANSSTCKAILYSQSMERYHSAFLQSPLPRGKLNWREFLKTSWTICSRPCGNIGEDWTQDSHPLANLQGLVTDYTPHTHTGAWLPPPPPFQVPAGLSVSHLTILSESTSIPLIWNVIFPSPYLQWSLLHFCPIHVITKNYDEKKGKTVQSTKCFTNTLLLVKETSQTS